VLSIGIWQISVYSAGNTVASVNLLAPIYSLVLDMWIVQIFKIIYPLIFSLVPVILVEAYKKLLRNDLWAELSVLFFVFLFVFYTEMMALARQMIAEIYLALLVYATVKKMNPLFLILFLASLAVSHYGTAYLTMFALLTLLFIQPLENKADNRISNNIIAVFWIVTLLWYSYVGGGVQFNNLAIIGYQTFLMLKDLFNPQYSQGLALIITKKTWVGEITKWVNIFAQGLISIGVLTIFYRLLKNEKLEHLEFYMLSFVFFAYDVAGVIVPYFSNRLNATRLYQITLFFLSPYLLIGTSAIVNSIKKFKGTVSLKDTIGRVVAVYLVVYFLFTSGFMHVITNNKSKPMWLEKVDGPYWSSSEIYGTKWIKENCPEDSVTYLGNYKFPLFLGLNLRTRNIGIDATVHPISGEKTYVYLGRDSIKEGKLELFGLGIGGVLEHKFIPISQSKLWYQLHDFEKIYANNEVSIYKYSTIINI